jgi:hypothetical protein
MQVRQVICNGRLLKRAELKMLLGGVNNFV